MTVQELFDYYNRTVWKNRLPRVSIRRRLKRGIRALLPKDQIGGCALRGFPYIWIHPTLTGRALKRVLIHEMCHLAAGWRGRGHNDRFFEEVCRCPEFVIHHECGKRQTAQLVKRIFDTGNKKPAL
jgi:predicted metal-dependent hydrolase